MVTTSRGISAVRPRTLRRKQERDQKAAERNQPTAHSSVRTLALGLLLVVFTLVLYSPVHDHSFINYDDKDYVVDNPHVNAGLSWETVRWSLTASEQANWHPLTWLSHALDCQFFGLDAGPHHIVNLVIHAFNVLLLFLLLQRATGAMWRSSVVAALFACHPFNVESVAWIAERKNLLSTLFFLLALGAYGWYARKPGWRRLAVVCGVFLLALASKPMVVTLPFVLLLLDYWPLQRVAGWTKTSSRFPVPQQSVWRLLLEKLPLFALSAVSCIVTVWAQRSGGALRSLQTFSLTTRMENALQSYAIYIVRTFWPFGFSIFYPLAGLSIPLWKPVLAALLLCAVSAAVWKLRRSRPYLLVGWLWFLGTLVPVIGLVQVGDQAMADRYAYLPLLGLFVVVVWGVADFFDLRGMGKEARWAFATVALAALCLLTVRQIGYWQDGGTIWSRALDVTHNNLQVEKQLANAFVMLGETDQALPHLINISRRDPKDTTTHVNLGACFAAQGRIQEATLQFEDVVQLTDHKDLSSDDRRFRTSAFLNLGFAYTRSKDYSKALVNLQGASEFDPSMVDKMITDFEHSISTRPTENSFLTLSLLLRARGRNLQATSVLEDAIKLNPEYVDSRNLLNYLNTQSRVREYLPVAGTLAQLAG